MGNTIITSSLLVTFTVQRLFLYKQQIPHSQPPFCVDITKNPVSILSPSRHNFRWKVTRWKSDKESRWHGLGFKFWPCRGVANLESAFCNVYAGLLHVGRLFEKERASGMRHGVFGLAKAADTWGRAVRISEGFEGVLGSWSSVEEVLASGRRGFSGDVSTWLTVGHFVGSTLSRESWNALQDSHLGRWGK